MAKAGAIRAGRAFVELFADDSKLVRGLNQAQLKLKRFGTDIARIGMQVAAAGAAVTGGLVAAGMQFAAMGDQMAKMSKRTGLSVEAVSQLAYAARLSGTSIESLETGVKRMQRTIDDAGRGLTTAQYALDAVGESAASLEGLSPEEQFTRLADALNAIDDPSKKAAIALQLFGRAGTELLPMLDDMRALRAEADRLGLTMSGKDAKAAEVLNDAMDRLRAVLAKLAFDVGAALGDTLTDIADKISTVIVAVSEWAKDNRGAIKIALAVAAAVTAVGGALVAVGTAFSVAAFAIGGLVVALKALPIIAAAAAVGFLLQRMGLVGKAVAWVRGQVESLREAFGGVAAAIRAGNLAQAMEIAVLAIKVKWTELVGWLKGIWSDLEVWFFASFRDIWDGFRSAAELAMHAVMRGFFSMIGLVRKVALALPGGKRIWSEIGGETLDRWNAWEQDDHRRRMAQISAENQAKLRGYQSEADAAKAAEAEKAAAARKALDEAIKRAKRPVKAAIDYEALKRTGKNVQALAAGGPVQGAFGALSARALAAMNSPMDRIADATEATADNTARIARNHDVAAAIFE